jgi:hypothetical protein
MKYFSLMASQDALSKQENSALNELKELKTDVSVSKQINQAAKGEVTATFSSAK